MFNKTWEVILKITNQHPNKLLESANKNQS